MSVLIVGTDHIDYLVTAALQAGIITTEQAQPLGQSLAQSNADAYLTRYSNHTDFPPLLIGDEDELDEEPDEEEQINTWARQYHWHPVDPAAITPAQTARAIACWQYQVDSTDDPESVPGWAELTELQAASPNADGPADDAAALPWVWTRAHN